MRVKDIVVGAEYALQQTKWGTPQRVAVEAVNVEAPGNYSWSAPRKGYIRVRYVQFSSTDLVRPQAIIATWDDYVTQKRAQQDARARYAAKQKQEWIERAERLRLLDERLFATGTPVRRVSVWDGGAVEALRAAGYDVDDDDNVTTAINNLGKAVQGAEPQVNLDIALAALDVK